MLLSLSEFMSFNPDELIALSFAFLLGGLIGLEREINGKPAGLRTNIIICVGSCAFTILAWHFGDNVSGDASSRIVAGVITGVGFLGGGVLIREGSSIHGLTTAASIWLVTSIGIACGIGQFAIALIVTVMALIVLLALSPLTHRVRKKRNDKAQTQQQ
ncbi:MAG: MgtC/SapB family protein [Anaerohalosphaera sp.]|nr:MgtC/SapB family protein [Anaerohalosphaera sp.]